LNASIHVDKALLDADIRGSLAHVKMLAKQRIIPLRAARRIEAGLRALRGKPLRIDPRLEDVHTHVERALEERIGRDAGRLHTARSRNDQVALDERLWLRDEAVPACIEAVRELQRALTAQAKRHAATLMPGYTHLQRAQPITFGHWALAHVEAFQRDAWRLYDDAARANASPLGAGALAGTSLPIDRAFTARALLFPAPAANSLDAVASRDALQEFGAACAIAMMNLSRLCEELVLWSSQEFAFVELDDRYATGSSIMPQKKNPDMPELVRGKAASVLGDAAALLALTLRLPLAYNKDLQEDKAPAFRAFAATRDSFRVMARAVATLRVRKDRMEAALHEGAGHMGATDAAEWLVRRGVPFREAHGAVGRWVAWCIAKGARLEDTPNAELSRFHPLLSRDVKRVLDPRHSVEARDHLGGPAPRQVLKQVAYWERALSRK
jgi:argininosuccinate lyase